jgi:hypothetical protein
MLDTRDMKNNKGQKERVFLTRSLQDEKNYTHFPQFLHQPSTA